MTLSNPEKEKKKIAQRKKKNNENNEEESIQSIFKLSMINLAKQTPKLQRTLMR